MSDSLTRTDPRQDNFAPAEAVLAEALRKRFPGRIALVSSFGTESAVLLHMIAAIDPATPVVFLDTGKLFPQTLAYREALVARLGLTDVRSIRPSPKTLAKYDPTGTLWRTDPDLCCAIRKTNPLDDALAGFEAWITGRKRVQGATRAAIEHFETGPDGRKVVNPLAFWTAEEIEAYFVRHDIPRHPLESQGYPSVGCATCTIRAAVSGDRRAGRWAGLDKTECGIHQPRQAAAFRQ
jgi:phosphoadenosine phosphosulfate reductase